MTTPLLRKKLPKQIETVGQRLRKVRKAYGFSQNDLAILLNINRSTYTYYELDKTLPSLNIIVSLAWFYKVSTDYLLGLVGEKDDF